MENNRSVSTQGTERTTTEIPNKEQIKADASQVVRKARTYDGSRSNQESRLAASQAEKARILSRTRLLS